MPTSGSGESGAGGRRRSCPICGSPTQPGDHFCRSCGAEQPQDRVDADQTEPLAGAAAEGRDLDPPTEETTRTEPPTERQAHSEETEALRPGPDPDRSGARRGLIAIAAAVVLGLLAGLIVVIVVNGGDGRGGAGSAKTAGTSSTTLDPVESLRAHFDLLEQGSFPTAADDLTPELLASLGGKTIWVSERIADFLIDAQLDAHVVEETDTTATVRVDSLRTESLANGCTDFSGSYTLLRSGERWLISSADLLDRPC